MQTNQKKDIRILIVDDSPDFQRLMEIILGKAGYEVFCVKDGHEALAAFEETFFPIVLTDWMMPGMDGVQLCQALRSKESVGYIFIVLLTAKDTKKDIIAGLEAGADDYLSKPVSRAELLARLKTGERILSLEKSLREAHERVRKLAITDTLTGCFNRTYLNERLPKEIKRTTRYGHPLSIILCDIDRFKTINDTYGHQAGDEVLKSFAERISQSLREHIDWVVRYGGEEFLIVLPDTKVHGAMVMAERIRQVIYEKPIQTQEHQLTITSSFGVTGIESGVANREISMMEFIQVADDYLYQSKQGGRNCVKGRALK